jgi:hypothetical protein
MGIRLQCPQGHKVHVKSFLAGKRGICPQCGAKFDIPPDPTLASDDTTGDEISVVPSPAPPAQTRGYPTRAVADAGITPVSPAGIQSPVDPGDPAQLDLDALAAAGGTSLLGGQAFGPAGQRLASRRKSAQTMRRFTLVLTAVVTVLACILLYMIFRAR